MLKFNQVDLNVRLQISSCKYAEIANAYANNLKYGISCSKSNLNKLILLNGYIDLLKNYEVGSDKNCITEQEAQEIADKISKLICVCFQYINFPYEDNTEDPIDPLTNFLLNDAGDYILQSDNFRIIIL